MRASPFPRYCTLTLLLPLVGCAGTGRYAVLLPRAIEKTSGGSATSQSPVTPPLAAEPELAAKLSTLETEALRGDQAFRALTEKSDAQRSAGRIAVPRSDNWIAAQQQLSAIEVARGPTVAALSALDGFYVRALEQNEAGLERIRQSRGKVAMLINSQDAILQLWRADLSQADTPPR